jgi:hypothetical protein
MSGIEKQEATLSDSGSGGFAAGLQTASEVQDVQHSHDSAAEAAEQGGPKPGAAVDLPRWPLLAIACVKCISPL